MADNRYYENVRRARARIVERVSLPVGLDVHGAGGRLSSALAGVRGRLPGLLEAGKPDYVRLLPGPSGPAAAPAYVVEVAVGETEIRGGLVGSETRVHRFTAYRERANPDVIILRRRLQEERLDLLRMQRLAQERCEHCGGRGHVRCDRCDGRGEVRCRECGGEGHLPCGRCGGSGEVDGGQCPACGGRGRVRCDRCKGSGRRPCPDCGKDGAPRGSRRCPHCRGTGRAHDISRHDLERKHGEVEHILWRLDHTTPFVRESYAEELPYVVDFHEKTGSLLAEIRVAAAPEGAVVVTDTVHERIVYEDKAIRDPNPQVGLEGDPLELPRDDEVEDELVLRLSREAAHKALAAVTDAWAAEVRAAAEQLDDEGREADAVEAWVDAAVVLESARPQEAKSIFARLAERIEINPR
jgi:hypothetical protein